MQVRTRQNLLWVALLLVCGGWWGGSRPKVPRPDLEVSDMAIKGELQGAYFTFQLDFTAVCRKRNQSLVLAQGDLGLVSVEGANGACEIRYDPAIHGYRAHWPKAGEWHVSARFAARPQVTDKGAWRESTFDVPAARMRTIEVTCDRKDVEVLFPNALRVKREVRKDALVLTALQGPVRPFTVRWKPKIAEMAAELVFGSEANVIVTVTPGALRVDSVFVFDMVQGALDKVSFRIPADLGVTQVRGEHIRDWSIEKTDTGPRLTVLLNRAEKKRYTLEVLGEQVLTSLPTEAETPLIQPEGALRSGGALVVGTDSALQLRILHTLGLSQIDASAFPRSNSSSGGARRIPEAKTFFYTFPSSPCQIKLAIDNTVSAYDAAEQLAIVVKEDDVQVQDDISLDIRDAPLRSIEATVPASFSVAGVSGKDVTDFTVRPGSDGAQALEVVFSKPVQGTVLFSVRLELGHSPLDAPVVIPALRVSGAKSQRGFIAAATDPGVEVTIDSPENLRRIPTGSLPMRVAGARHAFRFRAGDWRLGFSARRKPPVIRVQAFHLITAGDGILYGGITFNYYIAGAPVDELLFQVPAELKNVEFVGADVSRWEHETDHWRVHLRRKVAGDYNLMLSYNRRYTDGDTIPLGEAIAESVQSQTGYIVIASHLSLKLTPDPPPDAAVLAIERDELPASYQLLVNTPMLAAYKYVAAPHTVHLKIEYYQRGDLVPAVVDFMDLQTTLNVNKDRSTESVTRVRYKIKNSSRQFLSLHLPNGAHLWAVHRIQTSVDGTERSTALPASTDGDVLKVPLRRLRNPNEPLTVDIEYGETHGKLPGNGRLSLSAPVSGSPAAFAAWSVTAPRHWAVSPAGDSPETDPYAQSPALLALALNQAGMAWQKALRHMVRWFPGALYTAVAIALGVLILAFAYRGTLMGRLARVLLTGALVYAGAQAWNNSTPKVFSTVQTARSVCQTRYARPLPAAPNAPPLETSVRVVPFWRSFANVPELIAAALAILVGAMAIRYFRCSRIPWIALALSGLALAVCQFPLGGTLVLHALTWGWTAILLLAALYTLVHPTPPPAAPTDDINSGDTGPVDTPPTNAGDSTDGSPPEPTRSLKKPAAPVPQNATVVAAVVLGLFLPVGATHVSARQTAAPTAARQAVSAAQRAPNASQNAVPAPVLRIAPAPRREAPTPDDVHGPVLDLLTCRVTTEKDCAKISFHLDWVAEAGDRVPLIETRAILVSSAYPTPSTVVRENGDRYVLETFRKGRCTVDIDFLAPLPPADEAGRQTFKTELPTASIKSVEITIPENELELACPDALTWSMTEDAAAKTTTGRGVVVPDADFAVEWRPRARKLETEPVSFFCGAATLFLFDSGLCEGRHQLRFEVAQGEVREVHIHIPQGQTVTAVGGGKIGAWRFDPEKRELVVRLSEPITDAGDLLVVTQTAIEDLPATVMIGPLAVQDAKHQRCTIGLAATSAVYITVPQDLESINPADFARGAAALLSGDRAPRPDAVRHAFRTGKPETQIKVQVDEVKPEFRTSESADFTVGDDRLVYNGDFAVEISKSGVFSLDLTIPKAFDVDSLTAPMVSHWDIAGQTAETRTVRVYLRKKTVGTVPLKIALSHPVSGLPKELAVPRITLKDVRKHSGRLLISAARGVRLAIGDRKGVSELDPVELGVRTEGVVAFRLLKPDWQLTLKPETIEPRIEVGFLHVARVSDGRVQHTQSLRYRLHNAGIKTLTVQVPDGVTGLQITGPDIARKQPIAGQAGAWLIELNHKWFDRPYLLTVRYETRYDRGAGIVSIVPVRALGVDLQRGHLAVFSTERVELSTETIPEALQPADPRNVPAGFGGGSLAGAAYCFTSTRANWSLQLRAARHAAAGLLEAEVRSFSITTVAAPDGRTLNRLDINLTVGPKRFLRVQLPTGAEVWSLTVNRDACEPYREPGTTTRPTVLVSLQPALTGNRAVDVELTYTATPPADFDSADWQLAGPSIDLPLKNMRWTIFAPPGLRYHHFQGTLMPTERGGNGPVMTTYDLTVYDQRLRQQMTADIRQAKDLQAKGSQLASQGRQFEAKQVLKSAYNYSIVDQALNEDARVQLRKLTQEQALMGIVSQRKDLRPGQFNASAANTVQMPAANAAAPAAFNQSDVREVQNSLKKEDSENLEQITERMIGIQEAATGKAVQFLPTLPEYGQVLRLSRNLQVRPDAPVNVEFRASRRAGARTRDTLRAAALLFVNCLAFAGLAALLARFGTDARNYVSD